MLFSVRRKAPKDSLRLPPQTPKLLPGSAYPRLERCCSARGARTGHHSPCGKFVRLGARARRRKAADRTNGQAGGLRLLFVLFLSGQEKDTFLLYQRRIKMSFSHRRENDEKSRRDFCLGLSSCCWQAHTHGSQQTEPRTYVRSPSFAVREVYATGKSAPAGARRAPRERPPE